MTSISFRNAPAGTIRAALRYSAFRRLLSALAVSQIGDWLYNLALVVLVYDRTHSALWAGVTTAARVVSVPRNSLAFFSVSSVTPHTRSAASSSATFSRSHATCPAE